MQGRHFLLKPRIESVILILQHMDTGYLHQSSGRLWAGRPVFDFRQMKRFFFLDYPGGLLGLPYRLCNGLRGLGRAADRSAPCKAYINPLNAELNPICYFLALLAHHFLHVSRIRVKSLTLRLLMSYIYICIYIYIYMEHLFLMFLDHTQRRSIVGRTPLDE